MSVRGGFRVVRRAGLVASVVAVLASAACSMPSSGPPVALGAPEGNTAGAAGTPPMANPPITYSAEKYVDSYLRALRGQVNAQEQGDSLKAYFDKDSASAVSVANAPTVSIIREIGMSSELISDNLTEVHVSAHVIGTLDAKSGAFTPLSPPAVKELTFRMHTDPDALTDAPSGLYMLDTELHDTGYYDAHLVYYQGNRGGLIPDVRYLPRWLTPTQKATTIVNAVLAGPPTWMSQIAKPQQALALKDAYTPTDPSDSDTFVVSINAPPQPLKESDEIDLIRQIRWSLGDVHPSGEVPNSLTAAQVLLKVTGQSKDVSDPDDGYRSDNQLTFRSYAPVAFLVSGGQVKALGQSATPATVLKTSVNANVQYGAIDNGLDAAAFVQGGKPNLYVRWGAKTDPVKVPTDGTGFLQPAFLPRYTDPQPTKTLVYVVDGGLHVVASGSDPSGEANGGPEDAIQSFALSPDGYQVAIVAGGKLSLYALQADPTSPALYVRQAVDVSPMLTTVTAVAFSSADQMIVAGALDDGYGMIEMYSDGTIDPADTSSFNTKTTPIDLVSAYPLPPPHPTQNTNVMWQTVGSNTACQGRAQCNPIGDKAAKAPANPFYPD